jgi:hypothetical protein
MIRVIRRTGLLVALLALSLCFAVSPAAAVTADPYEFNSPATLQGDCSKPAYDPIPDPGCPDPPHPGKFREPSSIAIDSYGNEYVASAGDGAKGRIDFFDDEGKYIGTLKDENGPRSVAVDNDGNLYVIEQAPGKFIDLVRYAPEVYKPEEGEIAYDGSSREVLDTSESGGFAGVAVDTKTDRLFVAYNGSFVKEYGSLAEENKLLATITDPKLNQAVWPAVDAERRRLYVSSCKNAIFECVVLVFDADTHAFLKELDGSNVPAGEFSSDKGWISTAIEEETGNFFIADLAGPPARVYEFDKDYEYLSTLEHPRFNEATPLALQIAVSNSPLNPTAKNRGCVPLPCRGFLFVPIPTPQGPALAFNPPGAEAPDVSGLAATNIGEKDAEVQVTIDPRGADTEYRFEYVTEEEFDANEFLNALIAKEGTVPGQSQPVEVIALLEGLSPGADYRFRVTATNEKGSDQEAGSFATYADAPISSGCSNQDLRIGSAALLPDCRAYELVTPADTNGRPPKGLGASGGDVFPSPQVSPLGDAISFVTEGGSLPGSEGTGGFSGDLYQSSRGGSGWSTKRTGPSGTETNVPRPGASSPDQGYALWIAGGEGTAVVEGKASHYIRYPDGHAELIGRGLLGVDPTAAGKRITENGTHIIFQTSASLGDALQLEPNAPPTGTDAIYDRTPDGKTHVVSLLPGDVTPLAGEKAEFEDASTDGAGVAFTIGDNLYLRLNNEETFDIGSGVQDAGISEGGKRIFYVENDDLFAFDTETEAEIRFTETGDAVPVNVAPDGSRAYFISETVIPGSGENPNGEAPVLGQQNLYLSREGKEVRFVGTVTVRDVTGALSALNVLVDGLGLWTEVHGSDPAKDPSRVNADGSVLLFQSRANLTGYDSGGFTQIYRYDSADNALDCISCIPTKTPATGGALLQDYIFNATSGTRPGRAPLGYAALIPNLRSDGRRAVFESNEALVSTDTNGVRDVYEWEEQGVGSCTRPDGCVYLISSGHSERDNFLFGASETGDDVFFVTEDVLVAGDNDAQSVYDARVGGGFPTAPETECQGEGCRPVLTPPPALPTPAQPAQGDDNVKPKKPRKCPQGKRKVKRAGKVRCVKKKQKKQASRTSAGSKGVSK